MSPLVALDANQLAEVTTVTLRHYDQAAQSFWEGTRGHDVSQNVAALLRHLPEPGPAAILDFGCGPGRDLITFRDLGHEAVGVEGSERFVEMARAHSGCEVLHQDFLSVELPEERFDGVFANASLFHVPSQELSGVLAALWRCLKPGGVLFASNPHGPNREGWSGDRYGCYLDLPTWQRVMGDAGFAMLEHYFRPAGQPRHRQPWLASVWRKEAGRGGRREGDGD